ncbi:hypothetical protein CAPTEDRAFT_165112 [Capitella teleta]|uniref:Ribonuclease 3 n=1 Tax=Capitella teleta TaxID=283909 RepID=R7TLJ0_CAPTE|nr:hypothetical protein CAPTEDRAFT_165112 [Capitella teleta]|eukprot:ELT91975.1 hypothetical protein CAPTEDRAFT_165112 [Capitella teleta]
MRDELSTLLDKDEPENEVEIDLTQRLHHSGIPYLDDDLRDESAIPAWTRSSTADIYFEMTENKERVTTQRMQNLQNKFEHDLYRRAARVVAGLPSPKKTKAEPAGCQRGKEESSSSDSEDEEDEEELNEKLQSSWEDARRKRFSDPRRLHEKLWFNEPEEMNDGPICRCSLKNRQTGIRHNQYPGYKAPNKCNMESNNKQQLFHYQLTISPATNFLTKAPTTIEYDDHEYIFEGYSLLSHYKIQNVPVCKVIRFNIEYTIHWIESELPDNLSIRSVDLFSDYLYRELLELVDLDWLDAPDGHCPAYHIMPRFVRSLPDNGKEILSMNEVLLYLLRWNKPLVAEKDLSLLLKYDTNQWQKFVDDVRGTIVTYPGKRPSSLRIDQLDRSKISRGSTDYPLIVHFGIRPVQLSYAGDPKYQKLWKQYMKFKHLLSNKQKVSDADKQRLKALEDLLQELRLADSMKREVTVELSSEGFYRTGLHADVTQHALLVPVLVSHLRFHQCLDVLEERIQYKFNNRILLQLALTHPSFRIKFGTNPDHARNSLTNCGMRQLDYGDRKIHYQHRKRGINTLFHIMSKMGQKEEVQSEIFHYERLEFLGDAIVEFITSIHLFFMFPGVEEGGLTMYRIAIVQNPHLTKLAGKLNLQDFMLYAHGPDLCRDKDLRHAMANCFEALMGALFIDGGIDVADRVFADALFGEDNALFQAWTNLPQHPLQEDEPDGDRHWLTHSLHLQKVAKFEDAIGVQFNHIRLLAKAFSLRSVGYNNLTMGHNQRLEFLGDTIIQLITSEYLFKYFPDHHEGHLSLLRSSLVNNFTQSVVCEDLGMMDFVINYERKVSQPKRAKDRADLVEAFLGALYVDKGLAFCKIFCQVCFYPRLKEFIKNALWNDPKSQLQQCCLTLRGLEEEDPDIPIYKVLEFTGPTNTRKYTVAVYFKRHRLAVGQGHSIQQAEMNAAQSALKQKSKLFPLIRRQRKFLQAKFKKGSKGSDGELDEGEEEDVEEDQDEEGKKKSYSRSPSTERKDSRSRHRERFDNRSSESRQSSSRRREDDRRRSTSRERSRDSRSRSRRPSPEPRGRNSFDSFREKSINRH